MRLNHLFQIKVLILDYNELLQIILYLHKLPLKSTFISKLYNLDNRLLFIRLFEAAFKEFFYLFQPPLSFIVGLLIFIMKKVDVLLAHIFEFLLVNFFLFQQLFDFLDQILPVLVHKQTYFLEKRLVLQLQELQTGFKISDNR